MGCDVHSYLEKQVPGGWALAKKPDEDQQKVLDKHIAGTVDEEETGEEDNWLELPDCSITGGRHYAAFGLLSQVRYTSGIPLDPNGKPLQMAIDGFPEDASEPIRLLYKQWDCDAHTPGVVYWRQLSDALERIKIAVVLGQCEGHWLETAQDIADGFKSACDEENLNVLEARVVLWYDN